MVKRKKILSLLMIMALTTAVTGCGDGDIPLSNIFESQEHEEIFVVEAEPVGTPSSVESETIQKEDEQYSGDGQSLSLKTLAKQYVQDNRNMAARDLLEACYAMEQDAEAYEALQGLTVNAAEEAAVAEQLDLLIMNLDIPEYANESISMLFTEEWFDAMAPAYTQGKRSYYRESDDTTLYLEVGYDEQKQPYTSIWKKTGKELLVLQQTPNTLQSVTTGVYNDEYHGAFESWLCVASTGDVFYETGTYENGKCVGEYTAEVKWGKTEADIMSLWMMKEDMDFTTYSGSFDKNGFTTVKQPAESKMQVLSGGTVAGNSVVYAYHKDKKQYLFLNTEIAASEAVFTSRMMGLRDYPAFEAYEPVATDAEEKVELFDKSIALADLQVRIFEENVQIYDGSEWLVVGSVQEELQQPEAGNVSVNVYANRGAGKVVEEAVATAAPTEKPAVVPTKAPEATVKPTAAPATATPKPTVAPATATPKPTVAPATATPKPTVVPATATPKPTVAPATATPKPTVAPATATPKPTVAPATATPKPTVAPATATPKPTVAPTAVPTVAPTVAPTAAPTAAPTVAPTAAPTATPTQKPTGGTDTDVEWTPDMM